MNKLSIFNLVFCVLLFFILLHFSTTLEKTIVKNREYILENRWLIFEERKQMWLYAEEKGNAVIIPIRYEETRLEEEFDTYEV